MDFNPSTDSSTSTTPYIDEVDRVLVSFEKAKYFLSEISKKTDAQIQLWNQRRQASLENASSQVHHQPLYDYLMPKILRTNELAIDVVISLCKTDLLTEQITKVDLKHPEPQNQPVQTPISSTQQNSRFHNRHIQIETSAQHGQQQQQQKQDYLTTCGTTNDKYLQQPLSAASSQDFSLRSFKSGEPLTSNRLHFSLDNCNDNPATQAPHPTRSGARSFIEEQPVNDPVRNEQGLSPFQQSINNSAFRRPDTSSSLHTQEKTITNRFAPIDKPTEQLNRSYTGSPSIRAPENGRTKSMYPDRLQEPSALMTKDNYQVMNGLNPNSGSTVKQPLSIPPSVKNVSTNSMQQQQQPLLSHHNFSTPDSNSPSRSPLRVRKVTCPLQQIKRGTVWEKAEVVIVDHLSAFYIQNKEESCLKIFEKMLRDMNAYYDHLQQQNKLKPLENIEIGDFCVAQFSDDNLWYRARIIRSANPGLQVLYVDYGNYEEKGVSQLFPLDIQFSSIHAQVVGATLSKAFPNVSPKPDNIWPLDVIEIFQDELKDKEIKVKFVDKLFDWPLPFVELFIDNEMITEKLKHHIKITSNEDISHSLKHRFTNVEYLLFNVSVDDNDENE